MISIRVLQSITPEYAQAWITRFGFSAERNPAFLTLALGAGAVTPMQLATGYSVFANGGYLVNPVLITQVTDAKGKVLAAVDARAPDETQRVIDERNAFVMSRLLQEVTKTGTARKAQTTLRRPDLFGKTGTTNDSQDAWFAGYQPGLVAVVWIGYDTPRKMGDKETGGGLALPVWIDYMAKALKNVPIVEGRAPQGVVNQGGEWYFEEYAGGRGCGQSGPGRQASGRRFSAHRGGAQGHPRPVQSGLRPGRINRPVARSGVRARPGGWPAPRGRRRTPRRSWCPATSRRRT